MFTACLRHAAPGIARLAPLPVASSSRAVYAPTSLRSLDLVRRAHAVPRQTESGFEGVPAPAYNGPVDDVKGKGKGKETAQPAAQTQAAPRRKVEIKSKKAAISMVSHSWTVD